MINEAMFSPIKKEDERRKERERDGFACVEEDVGPISVT